MNSSVVAERELLEQIVRLWAAGLDCEVEMRELRDALSAQPAEAEGVQVVAYATPNEYGDWQMLFFDEKEAMLYVGDAPPAPLVLQSDHNAVTAERDDLRLQVEALRAEREARDWEMKAQGIESVIHYVVSKHDQDLLRRHAADKRSEGKRIAAMDAKEE